MKNLILVFLLLINLIMIKDASAQTLNFSQASQVIPYQLEITAHKTTLLIFPAAVQSADRGESYVLAERVRGAENVLKIKAGKKDFEPSNLQVITVDGKVYTFDLNYSSEPEMMTVDLRKQPPHAPVTFEGISINDKELEQYAAIVGSLKPSFKKGRDAKFGVELYLQGLYIKNEVLFLSYRLRNHSSLRFDLASLRFFIRDKKKGKRSAVRDHEMMPLYTSYIGKPEESQGQTVVVAFPKFSMAEEKFFAAELMELNGDRNPVSQFDQTLLWKSIPLR